MRISILLLFSLALLLTSSVCGDDKDAVKKEKLSKIPPLTFVGSLEGEIVHVEGGDRLVLKTKEIVPQWVSNSGAQAGAAGRVNNLVNLRSNTGGGGTFVPKEQIKDIPLNLSPDLKVRIMYTTASDNKKDTNTKSKKSKATKEKELAEKDPDYKLGGSAGTKSQLAKGQWVRVAVGRNNDLVNPQIYGMVVFVIKEGK